MFRAVFASLLSVHGLGDLRRPLWRLVHGGRAAKPSQGVGPCRDLLSMGRGPQGPRGRLLSLLIVLASLNLATAAQAEEVKVHGLVLIPWAKKVGEDRYRSPRDFEQTLRWYRKFFAGQRRVRTYREVNIPGVKYVHYENKAPNSDWQGLNIYQKSPRGQVMLYVLKRLPKKPKT